MDSTTADIELKMLAGASGTKRVDVLNSLAKEFSFRDAKRSLELFREAAALAEQLDYKHGLAFSILHQAHCNQQLSNTKEAFGQLFKALPLFQELQDSGRERLVLKLIGDMYVHTGNYKDALDYLFRSLKTVVDEEDKRFNGSVYVTIGRAYGDLGDYLEAIDYYSKALSLFKEAGEKHGEAVSLSNLGGVCMTTKDYDRGLDYLRSANKLAKELEFKKIEASSLLLMSSIYHQLEELSNAESYATEGLGLYQKISDKYGEADSYRILSKIAFSGNSIKSAYAYCQKALSLAEEIGKRQLVVDLYLLLAEICEKRGDFEQSIACYKKYYTLDKELVNADAHRASKNLRLQFEVEQARQEAEIHRLKNVELAGALQQLEQANDELQTLNKEKSELLNIAAHDLRNALLAVNNDSKSLHENFTILGNNDILKIAKRVERSSSQMLALIANILDINWIEHRGYNLSIEKIDWPDYVRHTLDIYKDKAGAKGIGLHAELEDGHYPVMADKEALRQIIDNLVSNAIKFSPKDRSVTVQLRPNGKAVTMEVRDQGPGLTADDKKRLFGKFERLSARPTAGEESTGLGLSIVKSLVELMNGRVYCESEEGAGAVFAVELPRSKK